MSKLFPFKIEFFSESAVVHEIKHEVIKVVSLVNPTVENLASVSSTLKGI